VNTKKQALGGNTTDEIAHDCINLAFMHYEAQNFKRDLSILSDCLSFDVVVPKPTTLRLSRLFYSPCVPFAVK